MLTALVTGATSGFGAATVRRFVAEGHRAIGIGRRTERLRALEAELGEAMHGVTLDVRDPAAVAALPTALPAPFADVDVLVNNAGLALGKETADEALPEDWQVMVETNILGLIGLTRAFLPGMTARGGGHIVNIGSIAGTYPYPGGNVYGATKAFVEHFSLNLRADLVGRRIRVTNIAPGLAETEFSLVRYKGDAERAAEVYRNTDVLTAEDIADSILWAVTRPRHVNVNRIEIMAGLQAYAPLLVVREED